MKTFLSLVLIYAVVLLCAAAEKLPADLVAGDWRGVIKQPSSPEIQQAAEALAQSKISTEDDAVNAARKGGLVVNAKDTFKVTALLRLAQPDPDLGKAGDFVWEVRVLKRNTTKVVGLDWVSATTGYVLVVYSAPENEPTPKEKPEKEIPPLSEKDKAAIIALVKAQTPEPISSIEPESRSKARVMTGTNMPLAGGGHWFELKRVGKKWKITQQGGWAS